MPPSAALWAALLALVAPCWPLVGAAAAPVLCASPLEGARWMTNYNTRPAVSNDGGIFVIGAQTKRYNSLCIWTRAGAVNGTNSTVTRIEGTQGQGIYGWADGYGLSGDGSMIWLAKRGLGLLCFISPKEVIAKKTPRCVEGFPYPISKVTISMDGKTAYVSTTYLRGGFKVVDVSWVVHGTSSGVTSPQALVNNSKRVVGFAVSENKDIAIATNQPSLCQGNAELVRCTITPTIPTCLNFSSQSAQHPELVLNYKLTPGRVCTLLNGHANCRSMPHGATVWASGWIADKPIIFYATKDFRICFVLTDSLRKGEGSASRVCTSPMRACTDRPDSALWAGDKNQLIFGFTGRDSGGPSSCVVTPEQMQEGTENGVRRLLMHPSGNTFAGFSPAVTAFASYDKAWDPRLICVGSIPF